MVFRKHQKTTGGNYGHREMKCVKCGVIIELGDVYYTIITKRFPKNFVRHFCENCYEKQYITA